MKTEQTELEIVMSWEGTPLRQHLTTDADAITAGEEGATFLLPTEVAPRDLTLATPRDGGWVVDPALLPGATLLAAAGGQKLETTAPIALEPGVTVEVRVGSFRFTLRGTDKTPVTPRAGFTLDRSLARLMAATFGFALLLVGIMMLAPPNAAAMTRDLSSDQARYLRYELQSIQQETPEPVVADGATGGGDGQPGEASPEAGDGEPGPQDAPGRTQMRRGERPAGTAVTAENVSELGTFQALRQLAANIAPNGGSPFGTDADVGRTWLGLQGTPGGDGLFGGLDMDGVGVGTCTGPNCGDGVARLTRLMDRPGQNGRPGAPGTGDLGPGRDRDPVVPRVRPSRVTTTGGLSRNAILRVVRRHRPEVLHCYQQQLQSRPDLTGRVDVRFLISPEGTVMSSVGSAGDGMTESVGSCVAQSVQRWTFPATEGVTSVRYPFVFTSH